MKSKAGRQVKEVNELSGFAARINGLSDLFELKELNLSPRSVFFNLSRPMDTFLRPFRTLLLPELLPENPSSSSA
jgi:hypothetical protein